jgi:glutamate synthase domain-containing protein 3
MTGGRVVILGETGRNFGAGLSGGIAYVLDKDGSFSTRCNLETLDLDPLEDQDLSELKVLIERHLEHTGSAVASRLLSDWVNASQQFVKVMPQDYKRVLNEGLVERVALSA